jgi:hypothetical protein
VNVYIGEFAMLAASTPGVFAGFTFRSSSRIAISKPGMGKPAAPGFTGCLRA